MTTHRVRGMISHARLWRRTIERHNAQLVVYFSKSFLAKDGATFCCKSEGHASQARRKAEGIGRK